MKLKPGTRIRRISRNSESCRVFVGKVYTVDSQQNGFLKLRERKQDGYSWELRNFEVVK